MQLFDYVDRAALMEQIAAGMVKEQAHSSLPLRILNYTAKAQYTPELWNEVTDKCRGLIFHAVTGKIVARPFVKFWNFGDARHLETLPENLPASAPVITRKMDGSLGIYYWYGGKSYIATRGSFASDQAKWATRWLEQSVAGMLWPEGWTPLFEIIYPENQIVVKYDWSGLALLALVNNETGEELDPVPLQAIADTNGVRVVDHFDKPLNVCVTEDVENEEGYVATWHRPGTWPLRVKIKMETYCTLHRLLTQTNPVTVWEMLRDGLGLESVTMNAPADFVVWINDVEKRLRVQYREIEDATLTAMLRYPGEKNIATPEKRKQFALYATQQQPVTPILFAMLDRKDYAPIIWKMVRPKGNEERAFKVDIDL
jgi:RNA ligase